MFSLYNNNIEIRLPSLVFWLEKLHHINNAIKKEDNTKFERLDELSKIIKIKTLRPFRLPVNFLGNPKLKECLGSNRFTWRVIPKSNSAPKLRLIGKNFKTARQWLKKNRIDLSKYKYIEIVRDFGRPQYSAIFLINDRGIWGEMISGHIWRLAQGVHHRPPKLFYFHHNKWFFSDSNPAGRRLIKAILRHLKVSRQKNRLFKKLKSQFTPDNYLKGYFEVYVMNNHQIIFNDYNRALYRMMKNFKFFLNKKSNLELHGRGVITGATMGKIINTGQIGKNKIGPNNIIACKAVTVRHLPMLKKAAAVISERGNALSHAAIVLRELKKPYIVNIPNLTKKLKTGDLVFVNASAGTVTKL